MGSECARLSPKPGTAPLPNRLETTQENEFSRCSEILFLQIRVQNLRLSNLIDVAEKIVFKIDGFFDATFPKSELQVHEKTFKISGEDIERKSMQILIYDSKGKVAERLELKLSQLCTGPSHQDHLLQKMKARLAFDIRITQRLTAKLAVTGLTLDIFGNQKNNPREFAYSLSLRAGDDDQVYETDMKFLWKKTSNNQLNLEILSHSLRQSTIQITLWRNQEAQSFEYPYAIDHYSDIYIPYQRVANQIYRSCLEERKEVEQRKVEFKEQIMVDGVRKGFASFTLAVTTSKLYVEQMECLIFTENGIGTVSPHEISCEKQAAVEINELKVELEKLQKLQKYSNKEKLALKKILMNIYEMTKKDCKVFYTSNEELYAFQLILLEILQQVSSTIRGGEDIVNENLWRVINTIIHRPELSIRYINFHSGDKCKRQIGIKFYCFICLLLEKIIQSTTIGVTFHELKCIQKFIAYAYFRFPWMQKNIIKYISRQGDPQINSEKMIEFGACVAVKSPSKSVVYDWESSVFSLVRSSDEFKKVMSTLEELTFEVPEWGKILFNRGDDDLFYGLYIEIWNEAEVTLEHCGQVRWEYFPYYGELLSAFLGEMNKNPILEYSTQFRDCSLKLVSNERLLNSFMMLLFAKTCLYQSYCVMKCLDLIKGYFEVLTHKKRRLPADFNFNYFYTGLRTILDSGHSYLLVKALSLVYDHYSLFSRQFKMTINVYILGKPFFNLFLHWCGYVRKTFYYLLHFRVKPFFQSNPEDSFLRLTTVDDKKIYHKYESLIHSLEQLEKEVADERKKEKRLEKAGYHERMKEKIKKKVEARKSQQIKHPLASSWDHEEKNIRKVSQCQELELKVRRWSMSSDELDTDKIDHSLKKYVLKSMKEFKEILSDPSPNARVTDIEKMFSDGGVSIDS